MAQIIKFSDTYMKLIGKLSKNINRADERKLALFFKNSEERVCISVTGLQTVVHIDSPKSHAELPTDEFAVTDLAQFCKYASAIKYPMIGTQVVFDNVKTTKGREVPSISFTGANLTYRMMAADFGEFDAKYDRKIPTPSDRDVLRLAAKIVFTPDLLKQLTETRNLIGSDAENFCISIDDGVFSIYMRGMLGQQGKIDIDSMNYVVYSDFDTKVKKQQSFKLFSLNFFDAMKFFGVQFTCEIRVYDAGDDQTIVLKAYGEYGSEAEEKIKIIVACQEAEAAVMANSFDIVL